MRAHRVILRLVRPAGPVAAAPVRVVARRWCADVLSRLESYRLQCSAADEAAAAAARSAISIMKENESVEVHRAALRALAAFDTTDSNTALIVEGDGCPTVAQSLRKHHADPEAAELALRLCANMCLLTLQDASDASNQAVLGAFGATTFAAQALHEHGRTDHGVCRRALQALLHLTMFNSSNVKELLRADGVTVVASMLAKHPESHEVQDTGMGLLLRLLNSPADDESADYVYEHSPGTALDLLFRAVVHHPDSPSVHDKVWQGLALLSHNHRSVPDILERMDRQTVATLCDVLQRLATLRDAEGEVAALREQMLGSFASVLTTLVGVRDADPRHLAAGRVSEVIIAALNTGVDPGLQYSLIGLALALSPYEDPVLPRSNGMATVLRTLADAPSDAQRKQLLRLVWNLLGFDEGRLSFGTLRGAGIVEQAGKESEDAETKKMAEDILEKAKRPALE